MADILGLSHLIFSSKNRLLPANSRFASLFSRPIFNRFDHFDAKKSLLRNQIRRETELALYVSSEGDIPGFELIPSDCEISRPPSSYGLIFDLKFAEVFKDSQVCEMPAEIEALDLRSLHFEPEIPSLAAISPILEKYSCTMGVWQCFSDIDAASAFLTDVIGARPMLKTSSVALFSVKVINRKFSNFLIAAIKNGDTNAYYYNDDIGLAAFGWIAKRKVVLPAKFAESFSISPEFDIDMPGKRFKAEFIFDNISPSHEIMTLDKK